MLGQVKTDAGTGTGSSAPVAPRAPAQGTATLKDALRSHPAGPELLAVIGALADRPLRDGWTQWDAAHWDAYLDAVVVEAWTQRAGAPGAAHAATH